jgi:hypothetical protein
MADPIDSRAPFDKTKVWRVRGRVLSKTGEPLFPLAESTPNVSSAETPLPSTWSMLLIGVAGLGVVAFRGTKKAPAAPVAA